MLVLFKESCAMDRVKISRDTIVTQKVLIVLLEYTLVVMVFLTKIRVVPALRIVKNRQFNSAGLFAFLRVSIEVAAQLQRGLPLRRF